MAEQLKGLMETIYRTENAGRLDYNVIYGKIRQADRPSRPVTQMTVGEVMEWQNRINRKYDSEAVGAVQIIRQTLEERVKSGVVSRDDLFDKKTQDRITVSLLRKRGLDAWQAGRMSTEDFGTNLAKEWASLPVLKDTYDARGRAIGEGSAYYGGVGSNTARAHLSSKDLARQLGEPGTPIYNAADWPGTASRVQRITDPAGTKVTPGFNQRLREQTLWGELDPFRHMEPWEIPDADITPDRSFARGPVSEEGRPSPFGSARRIGVDYQTRTGPGGGPVKTSWGQAFMDEYTDGFFIRQAQETIEQARFPWDDSFNPAERVKADGLQSHWEYLGFARNAAHYDHLKRNLKLEGLRGQRREAWSGVGAQTLGAILNPDSVVSLAIPGGISAVALRRGAATAGGTAFRAASFTGAYEVAVEGGRSRLDPYSNEIDSAIRVGGPVAFSGLVGGLVGASIRGSARRKLVQAVEKELATEARAFTLTPRDVGRSRPAAVREIDGSLPVTVPRADRARGVAVVGDEILVDTQRILRRFEREKGSSPARTATEFMAHQVELTARVHKKLEELDETLLARSARSFRSDESGAVGPKGRKSAVRPATRNAAGNLEVDRKAIEKALKEGEPIALGPSAGSARERLIKPIEVDPRTIGDADAVERAVRWADGFANTARDQHEFEMMLEGMFHREKVKFDDVLTPEQRDLKAKAFAEAEREAGQELENFRQKNNRILQDAKSAALSRMLDSPYKRIHRNGLSTEARDLVDRLAADGAFLRKSDKAGVTVGASVYSRAQTWNGVVRELIEHERDIYRQYLGFEPGARGLKVAVAEAGKKIRGAEGKISKPDFRHRVTMAHITGELDEIPEVNQMTEKLRGAWAKYRGPAEEYGVLTSRKTLQAKKKSIQRRLKNLIAKDPDAEDIEVLKKQVGDLDKAMDATDLEPNEDYFTRVWNAMAIRDNRDFFKESIVKPWMRQQPMIDVWKIGKDELTDEIARLRAANAPGKQISELTRRRDLAPEFSRWETIKASMAPADIDKRADDFIDTILQEAEPEDLATLREAHRPSFGRKRQFNIPNSMLLKSGTKGNSVADFIETDYLLVHKIYADRMGPAIEMARSFARPIDGIPARDGFEEALEVVRLRELELHRRTGQKGSFEKHWEPIERDYRHLKDRVTNRVIKDPNRWDNRTASALRNWSHLAFMGMSALPATQEIGKLVMAHGVRRTWQSALTGLDNSVDDVIRVAGVDEMRKSGILDIQMGASLARFAETGIEATNGTGMERWLRRNANRYFLWNGLAPVTARLKEMDAALRVSDTVGRIRLVADMGKGAPKADVEELARYGISISDAKRMAQEPIEEYEGGGWLANTDMWENEDLVRTFRAAIRQGNENTILLATAADKPIIVDGTVYIRRNALTDRAATRLGLDQVGNYWRMQSGLMTLPFTYWNYAIAATNKILVAGVDEPSAQKLGGIASLLGMGYLIAKIRTNETTWDKMSLKDRTVRGIDQSGVLGVLSQYQFLGQGTVIGLTGRNPLPFDPRQGHEPDPVDAAFMLMGAGPSVARNLVQGTVEGDVDRTSWSLPYRNHIVLKGMFDAMIDGIERNHAGLD